MPYLGIVFKVLSFLYLNFIMIANAFFPQSHMTVFPLKVKGLCVWITKEREDQVSLILQVSKKDLWGNREGRKLIL